MSLFFYCTSTLEHIRKEKNAHPRLRIQSIIGPIPGILRVTDSIKTKIDNHPLSKICSSQSRIELVVFLLDITEMSVGDNKFHQFPQEF